MAMSNLQALFKGLEMLDQGTTQLATSIAANKAAKEAKALNERFEQETNQLQQQLQTGGLDPSAYESQLQKLQDSQLEAQSQLGTQATANFLRAGASAADAQTMASRLGLAPNQLANLRLQRQQMDRADENLDKQLEARQKLADTRLKASAQSAAVPQTEGQKVLEREFAKATAEFVSNDRPNLVKNVEKVRSAISTLSDPENRSAFRGISQKLAGIANAAGSDYAIDTFFPTIARVRNDINSAVQETMRPILGAQFTEKEGERVKQLSYNINLDVEKNLQNAKALEQLAAMKIRVGDAIQEHISKGRPIDKINDVIKKATSKVQIFDESGKRTSFVPKFEYNPESTAGQGAAVEATGTPGATAPSSQTEMNYQNFME